MPRLIRAVPSYRRHRASGQAVVTLDGRDFYLGPCGTKASRLEYDRLVGEWIANGRRLSQPSEGHAAFSVNELILAFWKHAEKHYVKNGKPTSELHCLRAALRPLRQLYGHTPCREFGPLALKAVRGRMIEAGWCRRTINLHVSRIRHMFKWGVENELVPPTVYQALQALAGLQAGRCQARETRPRRPVPEAQIKAVKNAVAPEVCDLIDVQLLSGARSGELLSLTTAMLDRDTVAPDGEGAVWIVQLQGHKTEHFGKGRTLYFGPKAQQILWKYLKADRNARLFRYGVASYRRAITRACDRGFPAPEPLCQREGEAHREWMARLTPEQRKQLREWQKLTAGRRIGCGTRQGRRSELNAALRRPRSGWGTAG